MRADEKAGHFRYWEAVDGSFLSTTVVLTPQRLLKYEDHRFPHKDQTQLYVRAYASKLHGYLCCIRYRSTTIFGSQVFEPNVPSRARKEVRNSDA